MGRSGRRAIRRSSRDLRNRKLGRRSARIPADARRRACTPSRLVVGRIDRSGVLPAASGASDLVNPRGHLRRLDRVAARSRPRGAVGRLHPRLFAAARGVRGSIYLPGMFSQSIASTAREALGKIMADFHPAGFRLRAAALAHADTRDLLPTIDAPTLLIWGDEDVRSPMSVAHQLHSAIPNAQTRSDPRCGARQQPPRAGPVQRSRASILCLTSVLAVEEGDEMLGYDIRGEDVRNVLLTFEYRDPGIGQRVGHQVDVGLEKLGAVLAR